MDFNSLQSFLLLKLVLSSLASGIFFKLPHPFDKILVIVDGFLAICYDKIFQGHLVYF